MIDSTPALLPWPQSITSRGPALRATGTPSMLRTGRKSFLHLSLHTTNSSWLPSDLTLGLINYLILSNRSMSSACPYFKDSKLTGCNNVASSEVSTLMVSELVPVRKKKQRTLARSPACSNSPRNRNRHSAATPPFPSVPRVRAHSKRRPAAVCRRARSAARLRPGRSRAPRPARRRPPP